MQASAWNYSRDEGGLGTLVLDVPERSANTLSSTVLTQLGEQLDRIERDPPLGLVICSGKRSGFIAGAHSAGCQARPQGSLPGALRDR